MLHRVYRVGLRRVRPRQIAPSISLGREERRDGSRLQDPSRSACRCRRRRFTATTPILVHPLTDNSYDDHSRYAVWLGTPVALRLNTMSRTYRAEQYPTPR